MTRRLASVRWILPFLAGILLIRCGGSEVGNPERVTLGIVGIESSASRVNLHAMAGSGLTVTEARVVLSSIEFRPLSDCTSGGGSSARVQFEGPYVTDLLSNETVPQMDDGSIPTGTYCRVELKLDRLDESELPTGISPSDEIVGRSFLVKGTRGDGTPFVAVLDINDEFRIENKASGFEIDANAQAFFIAFDLALWFSGMDLDSGVVDSGTIYINDSQNKTLFDQLVDNIKTSTRLFQDQNSDGLLGLDEQNPNDVLGQGED